MEGTSQIDQIDLPTGERLLSHINDMVYCSRGLTGELRILCGGFYGQRGKAITDQASLNSLLTLDGTVLLNGVAAKFFHPADAELFAGSRTIRFDRTNADGEFFADFLISEAQPQQGNDL